MAMADLHISISVALSLYVLSLLFFFSNAHNHRLSVRLPLIGSLSLSAHQPNTDDVHDLLPQYGLPRGLLPDNVESYALDPSGHFSIQLTKPCYVHFDQLVYYEKEIKGKLTYGAVREVSGIQAKKLFLWLTITGMEVSKDGDGMIEFFAGALSEKLPAKQFEDVPVCRSKVADLRTKLASI
uniref:DUF538 family protein n=1 Tax=Rhizophora mucronata TaxID=61149 RepID=A0A2P2NG39_RHIMU